MAGVTVGISADVVNGDTSSIAALIATDGGDGVSLREAVLAANNTPGADAITFDFGHDGPEVIALSEGELLVTDTLTISGDGPDLLTIDAQQLSRVINVEAPSGAESTASLSLVGLRLVNALAVSESNLPFPIGGEAHVHHGGAIRFYSNGTLSISNSEIADSRAQALYALGGGVWSSSGSVNISDSVLQRIAGFAVAIDAGSAEFFRTTVRGSVPHTTSFGQASGGVRSATGDVRLVESLVVDNHGYGVFSKTGDVTIERSAIERNIWGDPSDNAPSTLYAGGGIRADLGALRLIDSRVLDNRSPDSGAGIRTLSGPVTVLGGAISGNAIDGAQRAQGGGISTEIGDITIVDAELSGNRVHSIVGSGAAVASTYGRVTITRGLIQDNHGGAIKTESGPITLIDTEVSRDRSEGLLGGPSAVSSNSGLVTLIGARVTDNVSGGVSSHTGDIQVEDSEVADNGGSGVRSSYGAVRVRGSEVSRNQGGGIGTHEGLIHVSHSTINGNKPLSWVISPGTGGGVRTTDGDVLIEDSQLIGNSATTHGGGVYAGSGQIIIRRSTLKQNDTDDGRNSSGRGDMDGGGVWSGEGDLLIESSTLSSNHAYRRDGRGGGVWSSDGTVTIVQSTLSGNTSWEGGSAVHIAAGRLELSHTTVTANDNTSSRVLAPIGATETGGAAVFLTQDAAGVELTIDHSILAGNASNTIGLSPDLGPGPQNSASAAHSLIGDSTGVGFIDNGGNVLDADPRLGPLAENGGPTRTHALLPGSPALDAGDAGYAGALAVDQRGVTAIARVAWGGSAERIDIGAYESQGQPVFHSADYNRDGRVDAADYSVWRDTLGETADLRADGDNSQVVDQLDYTVWAQAYGQGLILLSEPQPFEAVDGAFATLGQDPASRDDAPAAVFASAPGPSAAQRDLLLLTSSRRPAKRLATAAPPPAEISGSTTRSDREPAIRAEFLPVF